MTETSRSDATFTSLIGDTIEREAILPDGRTVPWCPPRVAEMLVRTVRDRNKALKGLCFQAVRMVRLMERADARGLVGFLYFNAKLPFLRKSQFERAFGAALADGRLTGIAEPTPTGLRLLEPAMGLENGSGFDLGYGQMAGVAAFVDFCYLIITPDRFNAVMASCYGPMASGTAKTITAALHKALEDALRPLLEREHLGRQSKKMHEYLVARGVTEPDLLNDAAILGFWSEVGIHLKLDGFRTFRNAANKIFVFRRAWGIERAEWAMAHSSDVDVTMLDAEAFYQPDYESDLAMLQGGSPIALSGDDWRSPLTTLFSPPCDKAKWIVKDNRASLAPLVFDPQSAADLKGASTDAPSLFFEAPPDPRFHRTVLRFSYFGSLQKLASGQAKKPAYTDLSTVQAELQKIAADIRKTIAHVTRLLLAQHQPAGIWAILHLYPEIEAEVHAMIAEIDVPIDARHDDFDSVVSGTTLGALIDAIRQIALADGKSVGSHLQAQTIKREGLNAEDAEEVDGQDHWQIGLDAMIALHGYVSTYLAWLAGQDLKRLLEEDLPVFEQGFAALYGNGDAAAPAVPA